MSTLDRLRECAGALPAVQLAVLFGSAARGQRRYASVGHARIHGDFTAGAAALRRYLELVASAAKT